MQMNQLRPASDFALRYGAKTVVYGAPGTGKTPILNTAPRPVLLCIEPGMLSMRQSHVPTWAGFTPKHIDEFFDWILKSNEAQNFDTICVDSVSQMAEVILEEELGRNKDGRKAYGEMSRRIMRHMNGIFFAQRKHTYLICKQASVEDGSSRMFRPYFPGQDLNVKIPHLFDVTMHLAIHNIPGAGQHKAFRTAASIDAVARDRSGKLNEFEPCDLTALFNKIMS
jgi:hypothetical protein